MSRLFTMWGRGKERGKRAGFFAVLSSPFSPETLICVRDFFRLTLFQRSFNWRSSPISMQSCHIGSVSISPPFPVQSASRSLFACFNGEGLGKGKPSPFPAMSQGTFS